MRTVTLMQPSDFKSVGGNMSLSILEVLENAEHNLKCPTIQIQYQIGLSQLSNVLYLIREKDYGLYDTFNEDDLLEK